MKISTKARLYYLGLTLLLLATLFLVMATQSQLVFFLITVPLMFFGQLFIFAKISTEVCPQCKKSVAQPKSNKAGFSWVYVVLSGKCNGCNSSI